MIARPHAQRVHILEGIERIDVLETCTYRWDDG